MFPYTGFFFNSHLPDMVLDIKDSKASSIAPIFFRNYNNKEYRDN